MAFKPRHAPIHDADELAPPRMRRGQPKLSARRVLGLEKRDLMAALGRDARCFETGRAGSDHHHLAGLLDVTDDLMPEGGFAPGGRIVDAERLGADIATVDAIGRAHAGPDVVFAAFHDLAGDMGIGEMRPGHADEVELAGLDGVARGGDIRDSRRMQHGHAGCSANAGREIEMRSRRHPVHRDHLDRGSLRVDMATDDVEEIDQPRGRDAPRYLKSFLGRNALRPVLVADHADADDEVGANGGANGLQHRPGEAQPVVQRSAERILTLVGGWRPEAVHQMAVSLDLDTVETGRLHPLRRGSIVGDDPLDVPELHDLGRRAMRRFAARRRRQDGKPVGMVPACPAAEMGDLDHDRRAVLMAFVGQASHPADDVVTPQEQISERRGRIAGDDARSRRHGQADAALGAFDMIEPVAILGHAILAVGRLMGSGDNPVPQFQMLDAVRAEKRIVLHTVLLTGSRIRGRFPESI